MQENPANFKFSWNSFENYWVCIVISEGDSLHQLEKELEKSALSPTIVDTTCLAIYSGKDWAENWAGIHLAINANNLTNPKIAIIPVDGPRPSVELIMSHLESVERTNLIAKNLWLADALAANQLICHFQPIIDRTAKPFGYEAFARIRLESGEVISGGRIIQAARELNIEHMLDKKLHQLAVKTFAQAELDGCLFINFMAGFIQRPEKYLEGLTEAVKQYDFLAKRIVLDIADAENIQDLNQITSIIEYCNSKGYSTALDDINSLKTLNDILYILSAKIDYIKLDRKIVHECYEKKIHKEIAKITEFAHEKGSMVLAEAIENQDSYNSLMDCGVDLFQGYHISQPMAVQDILSARKIAS